MLLIGGAAGALLAAGMTLTVVNTRRRINA